MHLHTCNENTRESKEENKKGEMGERGRTKWKTCKGNCLINFQAIGGKLKACELEVRGLANKTSF